MMFSAASLAILCYSGVAPISDGIALLGTKDNPTGVAVQIHRDHLFLVSSNLVPTETSMAYSPKGDTYTVKVMARDELTQLSLIRIEGWPAKSERVFQVASEKVVATTKLAAQLPNGLVSGQLVSMDRTGILMGSRRYVRLWEVRFETTDQKLGGAPVFTVDGRLAGIMNATLQPFGETTTAKIPLSSGAAQFGPKGMTVGYALGPKVLSRVVEGFLNEDRTPLHPTVGMFFRKAQGGGVELTSITQGSAAARAGLVVGDTLTRLNNEAIPDAYWLAARLFESEIGETLLFQMRRDERVSSVKVVVESLSEARQNRELNPRLLTVLSPSR